MGVLLALAAIGYCFYLSGRIKTLEEKLQNHEGVTQPVVDTVTSNASSFEEHAAQVAATPMASAQSTAAADPSGGFIAWVKEDFFVKLGALLLLIGFGWFVSYAFANNWIGPMGRITLGLVAGIAIMGLGVWRISDRRHQGSIFVVLGSTVVLLTIFAAREIYEFFTPAIALGTMFLTTAFVAFVSVRYHSERLALAGLILAGIAPLLTNTPNPDTLSLFSYLLVVVLGTLWVVYLTGANALPFAALLLVSFYGLPYMIGFSGEDGAIALMFAFGFTMIFFITNVLSILHRTSRGARTGQVVTALLTGIYLISWISSVAPDEWHSLLYVAWMMVFALGAFIVYVRTNYHIPFYIYSAVGIGLLAAATAAELDGPFLTIAYAIESLAIILAVLYGLKDNAIAHRLGLLFIAPILLSLGHLASSAWREGFIHGDFFALLILAVSLLVAGLALLESRPDDESDENVVAYGLVLGGGVYLLALVWLVFHAILPNDTAVTASLIVYTILGITLFVRGQQQEHNIIKICGGLLLGLVVGRLLFVDVWQMDLAGRIITFFAVGILLISTAFIGKKPKHDEPQS